MKRARDNSEQVWVRAALFYGGLALVGVGVALCFSLSAWGAVPALVGLGMVADAVL